MSTDDQFRVYHPAALGDAVRHFREEAGLTQAELAQQAGVHRSYLAELETGNVTEQTKRLVELFKLVGARIVVTKASW
jgi:transcriptional regulator with XRE-family HTH domain